MPRKYRFECYDCGETFDDPLIDYDSGCKNCDSMNYELLETCYKDDFHECMEE